MTTARLQYRQSTATGTASYIDIVIANAAVTTDVTSAGNIARRVFAAAAEQLNDEGCSGTDSLKRILATCNAYGTAATDTLDESITLMAGGTLVAASAIARNISSDDEAFVDRNGNKDWRVFES